MIAFLDVPLVYLSVRLMPDIHPQSIELAVPMKADADRLVRPGAC